MRIVLKNIGKVTSADIDINGITVIAGENNTGKSTVGRTLFAVFNSFYNTKEHIKEERTKGITSSLYSFARKFTKRVYLHNYVDKIAEDIIDISEKKEIREEDIFNILQEEFKEHTKKNLYGFQNAMDINEEGLIDVVSNIKNILEISDDRFLMAILSDKLNSEFNGQICNIFTDKPGEILLNIKNESVDITLNNEGMFLSRKKLKYSLCTEAVYIDDPFILDDYSDRYILGAGNSVEHRHHLQKKLGMKKSLTNIADKILVEEKLKYIYEKLNTVCSGNLIADSTSGFVYRKNNSDKELNAKNLSAGLKSFVILKSLLTNGIIEKNGTIILDEPEIHLHPQWQLLFAELIVLLQKEFNLHILLNTHSPYFLSAIEAYTAKNATADRCKYYLAEGEDGVSSIEDVTTNIEKIYQKLAKPLLNLENLRGDL